MFRTFFHVIIYISASDACSVWCHTRSGGLKSRGWTFPDGTTCLTKLGKKPMHCINGQCVVCKKSILML